ncbi:hypothetical protein [Luteimonas gilva]|uniref:hypothetical protein n=1 Tax=Luteimonas gilva TaxID=2572684 RepID=UPI001CB99120|nr:hypothetical protein [Luteimonas gilva]
MPESFTSESVLAPALGEASFAVRPAGGFKLLGRPYSVAFVALNVTLPAVFSVSAARCASGSVVSDRSLFAELSVLRAAEAAATFLAAGEAGLRRLAMMRSSKMPDRLRTR